MPDPNIAVCVKVVPKPEEIRVNRKTRRLERERARSEINPPDMNALEMALSLKDSLGGKITILSMGPALFEEPLRVCLAMGADHICLLNDRAFAGADTLATCYTLAHGLDKIGNIDLVFCGEESSDGATGQVPPGLAEQMGFNQITMVSEINVDLALKVVRGRREIKGGYEILEVPLPAVISVKTASNEPRFMDYRIKAWAFEEEQITIWNKADLKAEEARIGASGSPTLVSGLKQGKSRARKSIFLNGTPEEITSQLMAQLEEYIVDSKS
jgi:electron transfer flavoprotein beta subunit